MKEYDGDHSKPHIKKVYEKGYKIHYELEEDNKYKKLDFEVYLGDKVVAEAFFVHSGDEFHCNGIEVFEEHRRKGIATSLYVSAEEILKCELSNIWTSSESQTNMGDFLWQQPNRPFGNKS